MKPSDSSPNPEDEAILGALNEALDASGLTKAEVARRAGIPRTTLTQVLDGKRPLYMRQVFAIAEGLKMPAADLVRAAEARLDDTPEPPNTPTSEPDTNPTPDSEIILDGYSLAAKEWKDRTAEIEGHQEMP